MWAEVTLAVILSLMGLLGLITNIIAILILSRADMKSSNNYILKGIYIISTYLI